MKRTDCRLGPLARASASTLRRRGGPRRGVRGLRYLVIPAWIATAACGDDPFRVRWVESPDTVSLYSLARPELNLPSGFNFVSRAPVRIEAPTVAGRWDLAVDTRDDGFVLLPPGALGVTSTARITVLPGLTFEDVREAPRDTTLYRATEALPVQLGTVYVVRTHQELGSFGRLCVFYAKLVPLSVDPERQTLTFMFDASPVCNDRSLVPPE